jgi:hypothetical protein
MARTKLLVASVIAAALVPASAVGAPVVTTVAGTGTGGFSGDLGPGPAAQLRSPNGVARLTDGSLLIADSANARIRRVTGDGTITTVAGQFTNFTLADGIPALQASFTGAVKVISMPDGGYLVPDAHRLRRILPDGRITTFAGGVNLGFSGDGSSATSAKFNSIVDAAVEPSGSVVIIDRGNVRIRRVTNNIVTTIAGNGADAATGDGGLAVNASLASPKAIAVGTDGTIYVAETAQVRAIGTDGVIRRFAGTGVGGFSGDGGPATNAELRGSDGLSVAPDGSVLIADTLNDRVRRVDTLGTIRTIAGNGTRGTSPDGTPALDSSLNLPAAALGLTDGSVVIVNRGDHTVRKIGELPPPTPTPTPAPTPGPTPTATPAPTTPPLGGAALTVALKPSRVSGKAGRAIRLKVTLSAAAKVRISVRRQGRTITTLVKSLPSGGGTVTWRTRKSGAPLAAGRYDLAVTATAADGRTARTTGQATLRR